jgi:hypothetical protein
MCTDLRLVRLSDLHVSVARDHDDLVYYVRSYDSWVTDAHDLRALGVTDPTTAQRALPLPAA